MKNWKPIFIENSKVPGWLSHVAPIDIWAINLGPFVWILYVLFWLWNLVLYRNGAVAYMNNPFELEAYANDNKDDYLLTRKRYSWVKYVFG